MAASSKRQAADFQRFHRALDRDKGLIADLFFNYICLTEEIGEIGRLIKQTWRRQDSLLPQTGNRQEAMDQALVDAKADLQEELADALAFLLKIANDTGVDLEAGALLERLDEGADVVLVAAHVHDEVGPVTARRRVAARGRPACRRSAGGGAGGTPGEGERGGEEDDGEAGRAHAGRLRWGDGPAVG